MAWIESHQSLKDHPKLFALCASMDWGQDLTIGRIHRLWWWVLDYASDGDLQKFNDAQIASGMGVAISESKRLVEALVEARWLDRKPYFRVHDWWHYAGRFLQTKWKNNEPAWKRVRELYLEPPEQPPLGIDEAVLLAAEPNQPNQPNQPSTEAVVAAWNSRSILPRCLALNDKRKSTLKARLRDPFFRDNWAVAITKASESSFCRGENERGWKATFDWFIQPDSCAKIMEGKYDTNSRPKPAPDAKF